MEVGVLGPFVVHRDGVDVTPRGQRPRDLFTVLLSRRGHAVAPEVLLDLVWGEQAPRPAVTAVHTVVARLRRALGADAIETRDVGYRIAAETTTDADRFAELVRRGHEASAAGRRQDAIALHRSALAAWRGPVAYSGVTDELVLAQRARLDEQRCTATEDLIALLLHDAPAIDHEGGTDAEEARELALDLATRHPLRERPHALAMIAAFQTGRQAQALEIYRALRRRLRTELGVDPDPRTAALEAQVLAQDPALWGRSTGAPGGVAAVSPTSSSAGLQRGSRLVAREDPSTALTTNPRPMTALSAGRPPVPANETIGREPEVNAVIDALGRGRRLVTVVGAGGVGKSRLLAEVAARLPHDQAVTYLDLSGVGEVTAGELAESLAITSGHGCADDDPVVGLAAQLRSTVLVVFVDEAEGALEPVTSLLTTLLDQCPRLQFVVSSRAPLELVGESQVVLTPLPFPDRDSTAADAVATPAVQLLLARLADHGSAVALTAPNVAALGTIARRVDGLPLALELVAGHTAAHTLAELVDLVDTPLELTTTDRDRAARHQSLRETVLWSVTRLEPGQREVLRRLGVFVGAFDLAAAKAVVGAVGAREPHPRGQRPAAARGSATDIEQALRALVRDALVQVDRRGQRLRMRLLRTVRDLAVEGLAEQGELEAARRRHREWYAARWRGATVHDELLCDVSDSYDDYLESLRCSLHERDATTTGDLVLTLWRWWLFTEATGPGLRWSGRALDSGLLTPRQRAQLLVLRAGLLQHISWQQASHDLDEALCGLGDEPDWRAQHAIARCIEHYLAGDLVAAERQAALSVELARADAEHQLPESLATLAAVASAAGGGDRAISAAEEAWALIGAAPSAIHFAGVVPKIALALTDSGHPRRALEVLETAITGIRARLGVEPTHTMLVNAGWAALGCGDGVAALDWFTRALRERAGSIEGYAAAENLCGAAGALAAVGDPRADEVLRGAAELCARDEFTLSPWQRAQLEPHQRRLVEVGSAPLAESTAALTARLVTLVLGDQARVTTDTEETEQTGQTGASRTARGQQPGQVANSGSGKAVTPS